MAQTCTDWAFLGFPLLVLGLVLGVGGLWALHKYVDYRWGSKKADG